MPVGEPEMVEAARPVEVMRVGSAKGVPARRRPKLAIRRCPALAAAGQWPPARQFGCPACRTEMGLRRRLLC
jgi:hypothetical protein